MTLVIVLVCVTLFWFVPGFFAARMWLFDFNGDSPHVAVFMFFTGLVGYIAACTSANEDSVRKAHFLPEKAHNCGVQKPDVFKTVVKATFGVK